MMGKDDVVATTALKALDKEMRLRKTVTEQGYEYYCRGGILGTIGGILSICCLAWMLIKADMPAWGFMLFVMSIIGIIESGRQRERFNALLELMEIEKDKTKAIKIGSPIAESPSPNTEYTDRRE